MKKTITIISIIVISFISIIVFRGLMTCDMVAGHDSMAYPVTQQQFHQNIKEGVLFPRWAPDMRYGYGHAKLQYRPPLLHYVAEFIYIFADNYVLSLNLAVCFFVFAAAFGMFALMIQYVKPEYALLSAAAYITANYFLADIYLRGAYYEIVAYSWMPWILWSQYKIATTFFVKHKNTQIKVRGYLIGGAFFWCFLICGHPQVATFFMPLSLIYLIYLRNGKAALLNAGICVIGFCLAAPYFYVALRELPYVRMQLFDLNLENYYRHFLDIKRLLFEAWPASYKCHSEAVDYFGRPLYLEVRALNIWGMLVLLIVPFFWFRKKPDETDYQSHSQFFYFWVVATVFMATPLSWSLWDMADVLHTFNFPWRILNVTSLCIAVLAGLVISHLLDKVKNHYARYAILACVVALLVVDAVPHSKGWRFEEVPGKGWLRTEQIRRHPNIPQQFYTPKWVTDYAVRPASVYVFVVEGQGTAVLKKRNTVSWNIDIKAKTPVALLISHYFYPGWQLSGIGDNPIKAQVSPAGLMIFNIPAGQYNAVLEFGLTPDRVVGYLLAIIGLVILAAGYIILPLKQNKIIL